MAASIPDVTEQVSFEHGAAGHEGIKSNASGSLVIKPCTQAEIDFYESASAHPLFQAHIPTFIGGLAESDDAESIAPLIEQAGAAQGAAATAPPPQIAGTSKAGVVVADPTPGLIRRATTWKPSGGKKLTTGLAIVLENVTSGFKQPCVLDLKLGARLWDDDAPVSKRRRLDEVASKTTSGSLGFRVAGMKVYLDGQDETQQQPEENAEVKNGYKSYNKHYGQRLNQDNVTDAFTTYLGGAHRDESTGKIVFKKPRGALVAKRLLREVESIQYVLENEESRMYSASVLMVYEGDNEAIEVGLKIEEEGEGEPAQEAEEQEAEDDDEDDEATPQKVHEVRLIDFAHASWTPGQGPDENALQGVRSIVKILKDLT